MSVTVATTDYLYVAYRDRGGLVYDEVLCRAHYEELAHAGAFSGPSKHGQSIQVRPWHSERRCSACESEGGAL